MLDDNAMKWLREKTTMVLGADVTHPSPLSAPGTPSIAAVVASVDSDFIQYPASLRIQQPDPGKESKEACHVFPRVNVHAYVGADDRGDGSDGRRTSATLQKEEQGSSATYILLSGRCV
jgi:hypothetical protein